MAPPKKKAVRLKDVAEHLGLSTATVSLVLNRSPVAKSIPQATQERVFAAAKELKYTPNFLAQSLRKRRTFTVGVVVPEISEGYAAEIMHGVEAHLRKSGYFYLLASHLSKPDLLEEYMSLLQSRLVEGLIVLAGKIEKPVDVPTVSISGHEDVEGVTNVVVDEVEGARLALTHLAELGHERIAFFRGPPSNIDAAPRWRAIAEVAQELSIEIRPGLVVETRGTSYGEVFYQVGYSQAQKLLKTGLKFSALYTFNDILAIGAIRGFLDAGLRVPEDVSVIGFDDIESAAFLNPSLTTVRQPLQDMGERAGQVLLQRLADERQVEDVVVEPELIVRSSTGPAPVIDR